MNGRPPGDGVSLPSERTEADPRVINEVSDLVQPSMCDQSNAIVARPTDFVSTAWRLCDIHVEPKEIGIYMKTAPGRPAYPLREWNETAVEDGLVVDASSSGTQSSVSVAYHNQR